MSWDELSKNARDRAVAPAAKSWVMALSLVLGVLVLLASRAVLASDFDKPNNNGTATCNAYCENHGENWGRAGTCVGGKVLAGPGAGGPIACDRDLHGTIGNVVCRCRAPDGPPAGSFEKPGNNGSVACNAFCGNQGENWGPVGRCTGARSEQGAFGGRNIACGQLQPGNVVCYCRPPDGPPPGAIEKSGNNGAVNCDRFCRNDGENWGRAGICVGGRIRAGFDAGNNVSCDRTPAHAADIVCYCRTPQGPPPGAFAKPGNNGTVTCSQFCVNALEDYGRYGQCVGGRTEIGSGSGTNISCAQSLAHTASNVCYCNPQLPPELPAGAFEKHGNNGTATCRMFCENSNEEWGQYGVCVGGKGIGGPRNGADLGCDQSLPSLGEIACFCRPGPPLRPVSPPYFEKVGNNGTVSCDRFCLNEGANWGPRGSCVDGDIVGGKFKGKKIGCAQTIGLGSNVRCLCGPVAPPPAPHFETAQSTGCCADSAAASQYKCGRGQRVYKAKFSGPNNSDEQCKSGNYSVTIDGQSVRPTTCFNGDGYFLRNDSACKDFVEASGSVLASYCGHGPLGNSSASLMCQRRASSCSSQCHGACVAWLCGSDGAECSTKDPQFPVPCYCICPPN